MELSGILNAGDCGESRNGGFCMPATYTHFRFGQDVKQRLPKRLRKLVGLHEDLFDIGLYGPDILFYYHGAVANPVSLTGFRMHKRNAYGFFRRSLSLTTDERAVSYMLGFICHFALDGQCHDYIAEYEKKYGVRHLEIEAELDRSLMVTDGLNPFEYPLAGHVVPTTKNAEVIHRFFPWLSVRQIKGTLRDMLRCHHFLSARGALKRATLQLLFATTGTYRLLYGLVIKKRPSVRCVESCRELKKIYWKCVDLAVEMIVEYMEARAGKRRLGRRFNRCFAAEK